MRTLALVVLSALVACGSPSSPPNPPPISRMPRAVRASLLTYVPNAVVEQRQSDRWTDSEEWMAAPEQSWMPRSWVSIDANHKTGALNFQTMWIMLPRENFDAELDRFVASVLDPWIRVASHAELVQLIKRPLADRARLGTDRWEITADTDYSAPPIPWQRIRITVGNVPVLGSDLE